MGSFIIYDGNRISGHDIIPFIKILKNDILLKILEKYAFKSAGYDDNSENRKTADFHIFGMKPLKKQCTNIQNTAKVSFLSKIRKLGSCIK